MYWRLRDPDRPGGHDRRGRNNCGATVGGGPVPSVLGTACCRIADPRPSADPRPGRSSHRAQWHALADTGALGAGGSTVARERPRTVASRRRSTVVSARGSTENCSHSLPLYDAANAAADEDETVLMGFGCGGFYLDGPSVCADTLETSLRMGDWDDFNDDLDRLGVRYVIAPTFVADGKPLPPLVSARAVADLVREEEYDSLSRLLEERGRAPGDGRRLWPLPLGTEMTAGEHHNRASYEIRIHDEIGGTLWRRERRTDHRRHVRSMGARGAPHDGARAREHDLGALTENP